MLTRVCFVLVSVALIAGVVASDSCGCSSNRTMAITITADKDRYFSVVAPNFPYVPTDFTHGTLYGEPMTFTVFGMNSNCGIGLDCYDTFSFTMSYSSTYYGATVTGTDNGGSAKWECDQNTSIGYCGPKTITCKWSNSDKVYFDITLC